MELGNPCKGPDAELTFLGQSTCVLPVQGKKDTLIFMADRWNPKNAIDGRYVWLPIRPDPKDDYHNNIIIEWRDEWDLSCFDQ